MWLGYDMEWIVSLIDMRASKPNPPQALQEKIQSEVIPKLHIDFIGFLSLNLLEDPVFHKADFTVFMPWHGI